MKLCRSLWMFFSFILLFAVSANAGTTNTVVASKSVEDDKFTAPLIVPEGKLYEFEELNKKELESFPPEYLAKRKAEKQLLKINKKMADKNDTALFGGNKSFLCRMYKSVKCSAISGDSPENRNTVITKIIDTPLLGTVKIDGSDIVYTATKGKIGIDTFHYEIKDTVSGNTKTVRIRVLVCYDWLNGKYNLGSDSSLYIPPTAKYKYKQVRNFYKYFFINVKPVKNVLKGDKPTFDMAFVFSAKNKEGKDSLPAGYIWNYPYHKYFSKGNPVMTEGVNFSDLRVHHKYIKRYLFSIDIENYTLSSKNHWRGFQKWGVKPDSERGGWTGDVGFSLEDKDYNPRDMVHGKVKAAAYYKLTTYEGITGYFTDRRTPEEIKVDKPWSGLRVRIPMKNNIADAGGRMKITFDFWPFLKFMIDHKKWPAGYPLGGPIGSEVYNNKDLSNQDSRPAGETVIYKISHWIKTDLPPKKPIAPVVLSSANTSVTLNLKDIFSLPMMRLPIKGEAETHKWPALNPKFKIVGKYNKSIVLAGVKDDNLILKAGRVKGSLKLKIRCCDTFHEWYDDKIFSVTVK